MENAKRVLTGNVEFASSVAECAGRADVLAITTPWPEFRQLRPQDLKHSGARPTVLDCWRWLAKADLGRCADYLVLGVGPNGREDLNLETQAFEVSGTLYCSEPQSHEPDQSGQFERRPLTGF
jgi:hypothetical protein